MHNKKQKLTFFYFLQSNIEEDLFLPKIIRELEKNISQRERNIIKKRAKSIDVDIDNNSLKIIGLFYCLHTQKPRDGHMAMFTRRMIMETNIDLDIKTMKERNNKLKEFIDEMGLPALEGTSAQFIKNIYYYKPDFIDKYPELETKFTPDF